MRSRKIQPNNGRTHVLALKGRVRVILECIIGAAVERAGNGSPLDAKIAISVFKFRGDNNGEGNKGGRNK